MQSENPINNNAAAEASPDFQGGSGTLTDPYLIATLDQLNDLPAKGKV